MFRLPSNTKYDLARIKLFAKKKLAANMKIQTKATNQLIRKSFVDLDQQKKPCT